MYPIFGAKLPEPGSVRDYLYQRTPTHKHQGLDFPAPKGTPVLAVESGVIEKIAREYRRGFSGYGRIIVLRGDSKRWFLYAHLGTVTVEEGQTVLAGDKIGTVGTSVFSKQNPTLEMERGAHLHFEVSPRPYPQDSEAPRLDPREALAQARVIEYPSQPTGNGKKAAQKLYGRPTTAQTVIGVGLVVAALLWLLLKRL